MAHLVSVEGMQGVRANLKLKTDKICVGGGAMVPEENPNRNPGMYR